MRWLLLVVAPGLLPAHEPITTKLTWTREISRVVYKRCLGCHREGGRAPMSLATYDEARPWAKAIREEVLERRMPPWGAVKGFGEFRNDESLSEREIEMLANWVEGGAPQGEDIFLPPVPGAAAWPQEGAPPDTDAVDLGVHKKLERTVVAVGVRVEGGEGWQGAQVVAHRPDGTFLPLAWVQNRSRHQPRDYYFAQPMRLPKRTELRVASEGSPTTWLLVAR